ncbi:MAG: ABC transporter ATP-binding protein/permease [Hyphomicrobiaceae bacterium]|nr:MAG: ABC transporter ATP-binding protein/permease [Hyphomicrobiaceae bacterium]
MTAADFQAPDAPGFRLDPRVIGAFARFAGGYWRGDNAIRAWTLTLGLAAALLLSTAATVALNHWNRWFFDALERRDVETVTHAVFVFALIIVAMAAIGVLIVLARETLQVRWRAWIVEHLVNRWLGKQRFYHLNVSGKEPPNPEYRISDDTRWATEPLVDLGIGLVLAIAGAAAFISILWSVGGAISVSLGSWGTLTIPAYMVWVALAYGSLASGLMLWVGAPLVGYVGRKNEAEGYFSFAMMRIRDNAESGALMEGGRYGQAILGRFYDTVVARWLAIVWQHGHLTWITNSCGPMKPIVPLLFLAPKYLSGDLTLGQVTQLAAAFVEVQIAISWVVDNYNRVAEWYASARRVMDIVDACDASDRATAAGAGAEVSPSGAIRLTDFEIADGRNRPLLSGAGFAAAPGEAVHIYGDSSTGKSTLVRVLAGLWPRARGSVSMPAPGSVMIVPQKAYLPLGSLKGALLYPHPSLEISDDRLAAALEKVGLGALAPRLAEVARWDQVLSNGERQRLAVARLAISRPGALILDDALSALDEGTQAMLLAHLRAELPEAIIISLGQRPVPLGVHDRQLVLERMGETSILRPAGMPTMAVAR